MSRKEHVLTIRRPNDETLEILLDGAVIGSFNHDKYGWDGMGAAEHVALAIARATGITVDEAP